MRKSIIAIALLLGGGLAHADLTARNADGSNVLRLMPGACVHGETLGRLNPKVRDSFRKAQASIGGRLFFGCWIDIPDDGVVWVLLEGSEGFVLDRSQLKDEPGV